MKKGIIAIAALLLSLSASAQLRLELAGTFGGFASTRGIFPWRYTIDTRNGDLSGGLGASGSIMYDINVLGPDGVLFLEPGVTYLMNNSDFKGSDCRFCTQWLQVPFSVGTHVTGGQIGFRCAAGIYYGYAISGICHDPTMGGSGWDGKDYIGGGREDRLLKRHDFGFCARAEMTFPIGFGIFIGYNRGFLDLSDKSGFIAINNILRFGVSYTLPEFK